MTGTPGENQEAQGHEGGMTPAACAAARSAIAAFVGQSGSAAAPRAGDGGFRSHLLECADCMGLYRETVASAARLGKSIREDLVENHKRRIRSGMRQRARAATGDGRRRNRFGLRLALLPAGVALLILLVRGRGHDEGLRIQWTGGEVVAAGQLMDEDRQEFRLEPGDWCETRGNATAFVLTLDDSGVRRFELGPITAIQIEDPSASRIRLARGELEVVGPGVVLTPHGVLEIEVGRARLSLRGGTYDLACIEGQLLWTGPLGVRELVAGGGIEAGSILADVD